MHPTARKCVQDIRTNTNLTGENRTPQRKYLRLASLELRKALCNMVRRTACQRVAEMDRQLAEIEQEQAQVLRTIHTGLGVRAQPGTLHAGDGSTACERRVTIRY
jgi:hypothetical protein